MPFSFHFGGFGPEGFGGFQQEDGGFTPPPKRERKPRKAIGNAFTRTLINLGVTLLFGLVYFYLELPAQGTEDGADEKGCKQAEGHGPQSVNQIGPHRDVNIFPFQEFFHT